MSVRISVTAPGRADKLIAAHFPAVGRRQIAELFARGAVRLDGRVLVKGARIPSGAEIEVTEEPVPATGAPPRPVPDLALHVLYQDDDLVAVAKPGGQPCHPLRPQETDTTANALIARFPECAQASEHPREGGLVHRLDTGTSGLLIAARHVRAWRAMRRAFADRRIEKLYWALVRGAEVADGSCHQPLVHRGAHVRVADQRSHESALPATTEWRVVRRLQRNFCLLACRARTGRMHQVRVHLQHAGAPIVGDMRYGGTESPAPMSGFFLHARAMQFPHPGTDAPMTLTAPLPVARQALLDTLSD